MLVIELDVEDGGILGALVTCDACWGMGAEVGCDTCSSSGELHRPYVLPNGAHINLHRDKTLYDRVALRDRPVSPVDSL